jgi:hypothetical protein
MLKYNIENDSNKAISVLRPGNSITVFLDPRANAELLPKFNIALLASHGALPLVTSKLRSS